jgi:phasin
VPAELRAMTEKSIEQARAAFNTFMNAAQQAVSRFEGQTKAAQASAKDVSEKTMSYAERNVVSTFAFADRLVHANDVQHVIALQTEFVQAQMKELAEQAKELGETASQDRQDVRAAAEVMNKPGTTADPRCWQDWCWQDDEPEN